ERIACRRTGPRGGEKTACGTVRRITNTAITQPAWLNVICLEVYIVTGRNIFIEIVVVGHTGIESGGVHTGPHRFRGTSVHGPTIVDGRPVAVIDMLLGELNLSTQISGTTELGEPGRAAAGAPPARGDSHEIAFIFVAEQIDRH